MKKIYHLLVFTFSFTIFLSCGTSEQQPKDVLKDLFLALKDLDFNKANNLLTKDSQTMLDLMRLDKSEKSLNNIIKQISGENFEFGEQKIEGNKAIITVIKNGKEKSDITLKKEDDQWKVVFDKNAFGKFEPS